MTTLTHDEARRVYDRIGSLQDSQAFYEDRAIDLLVRHGDFETARHVFEFGCGTGRLAARLLAEHLPAAATYRGIDLSPTMVELATTRLAPFGERAEVALSDGGAPAMQPTASCDRFVSTYVFDLLSLEDVDAVLHQAHRMLVPGGLLCVAGLSNGTGLPSRLVAGLWTTVHRLAPQLVGGCRPLEVAPRLPPSRWTIRHLGRVAPFALPSEVVVAERR